MERIELCRLSDVAGNRPLRIRAADGTPVTVFNVDGTAVVTTDRCPHQGAPLTRYGETEDGAIVCLWHGCKFDRISGEAIDGPCPDPLKVYGSQVEDGIVYLLSG